MNYSKIISSIIRFLKKASGKDFLSEYNKVKKIKKSRNTKYNIIIIPFFFDNNHAFEAIYNRKAEFEGVDVYNYLCGQGIEYCEKINSVMKFKNIRCELCYKKQIEFSSKFNLNSWFMNDHINYQDNLVIEENIERFFSNDKNNFIFKGVNINKVLKSSLQRFYFEAEPVISDNQITRGFLKTIFISIIEFEKLYNKVNPKYVLTSHGTYSVWGSIVEYCKYHNIPIIVWGRVYNNWGIYFANDESYLTEMVNLDNNKWNDIKMTTQKKKLIVDYLDKRTSESDTDFIYDYNSDHKKQLDKSNIYKLLDIPKDKKIVGMFPNIPWDGSVTGVSEAFSSYIDWVKATIDFFIKRKNIYLLIRTHPAEKANDAEIGRETFSTIVNEIYNELPENIIIIPADSQINSFAVGKASEFGTYYCSTIGMELTYLGIPLICAGPSPLRNKFIVNDAKNKNDYQNLLSKGLKNKLKVSKTNMKNLLKFSYYNNFTRVMPEQFINYTRQGFKGLKFNDETFIFKNEVLEHLFQTIENKNDYNFDEFHL
ncbi:hypothetical protein [Halanaerobium congolense]|uniref:Capsule polysaccharide biosynthesis protein n=1 Tax=Halanaerobium congolense TaxID=54121 RepID=A0A1G6MS79_9FIRM|nr:hypothetical protein [Halanaerobium congolense]SDC58074.1 hypothetical protein SAMN04488597_10945 [Halanaerobium congolense]